jgi:hypothetical protein
VPVQANLIFENCELWGENAFYLCKPAQSLRTFAKHNMRPYFRGGGKPKFANMASLFAKMIKPTTPAPMERCIMTLGTFIHHNFTGFMGFPDFIRFRFDPSASESKIPDLFSLWVIIRHIASGLNFIHGLQEIHRDLKPQNSSCLQDSVNFYSHAISSAQCVANWRFRPHATRRVWCCYSHTDEPRIRRLSRTRIGNGAISGCSRERHICIRLRFT